MKTREFARVCVLASLSLIVPALAGPASEPSTGSIRFDSDPSDQRRATERTIVEVHELPAILRGEHLVVLDVRSEEEYRSGHLPGAFRVDYEEFERLTLGPETGLEHEAAWHERIGRMGISGRDTVIIHDCGRMTRAARVWFVLQHFGVADARVVNGGFPLIEAGVTRGELTLSTDAPPLRGVEFTPLDSNAGRIGTLDRFEVRAAIERGEAQVLDARTIDEFRGLDLRKNDRGGHLPTARNIPHRMLLDDEGRLRPVEELAAILDGAGFVRGQPVITHCDGGGRAALAALAASRAGYGPVLNYYLSFGDWAKDVSCPVVMPDE